MPTTRKNSGRTRKGRSGSVNKVVQGKPIRMYQNSKQNKVNKKSVYMNQGVAEKKLSAVNTIDEGPAVPIAVGSQAYKYNWVLGTNVPGSWTGSYVPLRGFTYPQGTGSQQRDGRYMFLDKTTLNMSIHMNAKATLSAPTQFRMVLFRARRASTPTGISYDPNVKLFLNSSGVAFGTGTAGVNFNDLYLQPTNKRHWVIIADKKFTLSPFLRDGTANTAAWQGQYPNYKLFRLLLNHKKKTSFQSNTNEPENYDYHYGCVIIAGRIGRDEVADGWEVNLRGTTSAIDN